MGRRSVWSDERLIAAASRFVPAADEVWRLQREDDPECVWFRTAAKGDPSPSAGSMQGIYVLTPGGRRLGGLNSNDPAAVLEMLERADARWRELAPAERRRGADLGAIAPRHRWEDSYPATGLVLERFARDVAPDPAAPPVLPVNRDAVWFSRQELMGLVPGSYEAGVAFDVDSGIALRLARVAFVDNVRGQTLPFSAGEVEVCQLRAEVAAVDGARVRMRLSGRTRAASDGTWRGGDNYWKPGEAWPRSVATEVYGRCEFDRAAFVFTAFELVAVGRRSGRTRFNGRHRDGEEGSHPIGFLVRLAAPSFRVAPTFLNVYGADWVRMPE